MHGAPASAVPDEAELREDGASQPASAARLRVRARARAAGRRAKRIRAVGRI